MRLTDLYDKFVDKLVVLGLDSGISEDEPLFHFDDVPEVKGELKGIMQDYATEQLATYKSGITSGVALAFDHDSANLSGFSVLSNTAIEEVRKSVAEAHLRSRLSPLYGLDLSQNVWNYTEQAKSEFEVAVGNVLADGMRGGRSAESIGRQVREYLNNPDMMYRRYHENVVENGTPKDVVFWRKRIVDENGKVRFVKVPIEKVGQGQYRSSRKNGLRLARTEINAAYHKANYERWQKEPFVIGIRIFLSPQHPVYDICDPLEGDYPKDFLWMGWHPQCMCASAPITIQGEERREFYRRMLRGEDMSGYESPNAIKDVPEAYKQYVRDNVDKIVDADLRGKLAWHLRDNRKYWENIDLTSAKEEVSEDPRIAQNRAEFERLKRDPNYEDVAFDENNGGLKATHKKHKKHPNDGDRAFKDLDPNRKGFNGSELEVECQKELFRMGRKAILLKEGEETEKGKEKSALDLDLDSNIMDIRSLTGGKIINALISKEKQIKKAREQSGIHSDNLCIFIYDPDQYSLKDVQEAFDSYKTNKTRYGHKLIIKRIYCVIKGADNYVVID